MARKTPIVRKSITPAQFRNFIFAGRSVFTLENSESGNYITFRIKSVKKQGKVIPNEFTVEAKVLGDASSGYSFMGFLNLNRQTFKEWGSMAKGSISYKTFYWIMKNFNRLEDFGKLSIYHEGACCKCGMPLTVPESIDSGIGPECKRKMFQSSIDTLKGLGTWDDSLSYDDNVRKGLAKNPSLWGKIQIPEGIEKEKDYSAHRLLSRCGVFG